MPKNRMAYSLSELQGRVLDELDKANGKPVHPVDIAGELKLDQDQVGQALKKLRDCGWVWAEWWSHSARVWTNRPGPGKMARYRLTDTGTIAHELWQRTKE